MCCSQRLVLTKVSRWFVSSGQVRPKIATILLLWSIFHVSLSLTGFHKYPRMKNWVVQPVPADASEKVILRELSRAADQLLKLDTTQIAEEVTREQGSFFLAIQVCICYHGVLHGSYIFC